MHTDAAAAPARASPTTSRTWRRRSTPPAWGCGSSCPPRSCSSRCSSPPTRVYRFLFPVGFDEASKLAHVAMGATNTVVLITSSLTVALAIHYARQGENRKVVGLLAVTILFGAVFMVLKGFEYHHHWLRRAAARAPLPLRRPRRVRA